MEGQKSWPTAQYFFVIVFILLMYVSFLMIKPFITGIIGGLILSYIFYPVYIRLYRITKLEKTSALLICLFIILIMIVPLVILGNSLSKERESIIQFGKSTLAVTGDPCVENSEIACRIYTWFIHIATDPRYADIINTSIQQAIQYFALQIRGFVVALPTVLTEAFIAIFICYYMVRKGKDIILKLEAVLPLNKEHSRRVSEHVNQTIQGVLYGQVIVGIIQGVIATIGYYIFHIPSPLVFGLMTMVASFLPVAGTAIVWMPIALIKLIASIAVNDVTGTLQAIGLLIWGAVLISLVDNIIRPKIIGDRARVHPVLVLLGVLGGIVVFGVIGLILGPLLLTLLVEFTKIYINEYASFQNKDT